MKELDEVLIPMQKHIKPLDMNGLQGRVLFIKKSPKAKNDRNILLIYGHHASIERMYGIAEALSDYGHVTMPDIPGFGGMDSFYKIRMNADFDSYADYLAAFIKLKYRNKKITIVGMSLGFALLTRTLQRYPELTKQVVMSISVVGFAHHQDFVFPAYKMKFFRLATKFISLKPVSNIYYNIFLHPAVIRMGYQYTTNAKHKFAPLSEDEKKAAIEFEVKLWRDNDARTHWTTLNSMLRLDNCKQHIDLSIDHIQVGGDQYFDNNNVEQHFRIIFNDFRDHLAVMDSHAPSILADKTSAAPLLPKSLRKRLTSK